jgi:hypothetical protein
MRQLHRVRVSELGRGAAPAEHPAPGVHDGHADRRRAGRRRGGRVRTTSAAARRNRGGARWPATRRQAAAARASRCRTRSSSEGQAGAGGSGPARRTDKNSGGQTLRGARKGTLLLEGACPTDKNSGGQTLRGAGGRDRGADLQDGVEAGDSQRLGHGRLRRHQHQPPARGAEPAVQPDQPAQGGAGGVPDPAQVEVQPGAGAARDQPVQEPADDFAVVLVQAVEPAEADDEAIRGWRTGRGSGSGSGAIAGTAFRGGPSGRVRSGRSRGGVFAGGEDQPGDDEAGERPAPLLLRRPRREGGAVDEQLKEES